MLSLPLFPPIPLFFFFSPSPPSEFMPHLTVLSAYSWLCALGLITSGDVQTICCAKDQTISALFEKARTFSAVLFLSGPNRLFIFSVYPAVLWFFDVVFLAKGKGQPQTRVNLNTALVEDIISLEEVDGEMKSVIESLKDTFNKTVNIRTSPG